MKQIINRNVYDTEKAEELANFSNNLSVSDFNFLDETLYQTKSGQFFLEYHGGANSKYAEHYGNLSSGSKGIKVLTKDEVIEWCELHKEPEIIERFFKDDLTYL